MAGIGAVAIAARVSLWVPGGLSRTGLTNRRAAGAKVPGDIQLLVRPARPSIRYRNGMVATAATIPMNNLSAELLMMTFRMRVATSIREGLRGD